MEEIKKMYTKYHSQEEIDKRQWLIDHRLNILFEDFFIGGAKNTASRGKTKVAVNRYIGEERMFDVWSNLDFFLEECQKVGFKVELGNEHQLFRRFYISGWADENNDENVDE